MEKKLLMLNKKVEARKSIRVEHFMVKDESMA